MTERDAAHHFAEAWNAATWVEKARMLEILQERTEFAINEPASSWRQTAVVCILSAMAATAAVAVVMGLTAGETHLAPGAVFLVLVFAFLIVLAMEGSSEDDRRPRIEWHPQAVALGKSEIVDGETP